VEEVVVELQMGEAELVEVLGLWAIGQPALSHNPFRRKEKHPLSSSYSGEILDEEERREERTRVERRTKIGKSQNRHCSCCPSCCLMLLSRMGEPLISFALQANECCAFLLGKAVIRFVHYP